MADVDAAFALALSDELARSVEARWATGMLLEMLREISLWFAIEPIEEQPGRDRPELGVRMEVRDGAQHLVAYTSSGQLQEQLDDPSLMLAPSPVRGLAEMVLDNEVSLVVSDGICYVSLSRGQVALLADRDPVPIRAVVPLDVVEEILDRRTLMMLRALLGQVPEVSAVHVGRSTGEPSRRIVGVAVHAPPPPGFLAALGRCLTVPTILDLCYLDGSRSTAPLLALPAFRR